MMTAGPLSKETALLVVLVLLLSVVSFSGCSNDRATPHFSEDVLERLDSAIASAMSYDDLPGVVGVWVPGEGDYMVAKGKANLKTGEQRDLGTLSGSAPSPRHSPPRLSCSSLMRENSANPTDSRNGIRTFLMRNRSL
jgi:hypothetical protein